METVWRFRIHDSWSSLLRFTTAGHHKCWLFFVKFSCEYALGSFAIGTRVSIIIIFMSSEKFTNALYSGVFCARRLPASRTRVRDRIRYDRRSRRSVVRKSCRSVKRTFYAYFVRYRRAISRVGTKKVVLDLSNRFLYGTILFHVSAKYRGTVRVYKYFTGV